MSAFEAYRMFLAVKQHFTLPKYDYFQYNGKVKASESSFERRPDRFHFAKLAKRKDLLNFLVSNFLEKTSWVGDLLSPEAETVYNEWLKRTQSLSYIFENELKQLEGNFIKAFLVKNGQAPEIINLYRQKKISIETIVILNDLLHFFPYWDKMIIDTIVYPSFRDKCLKYRPFLHYDKDKIKNIVRPYLK